jgi:HD-GYP domain-containing protein (c-di-GMP phosphodiesterase class II)
MVAETAPAPLRVTELLAALSLGVDLGFGQPMEHVLRQCVIALRLAERCGLDVPRRSEVYFTALLINVGCHSDAHEQAKWFGDDIAIKAAKFPHGMRVRGTASAMRMLGAGHPPLHRFRLGLEFAIAGHREMNVGLHSQVARALANKLGLPAAVNAALEAAYEHWDGRGWPGKMAGETIPLPARIAQISEYLEVAHRMGGVESARRLGRDLSGSQFDPTLARLASAEGGQLFQDLDRLQTWKAVIDAEPALQHPLAEAEIDSALSAVAEFVDLKSPYCLGHSTNVAELAAAAAESLRLPSTDRQLLYRAALVHHFGRFGVSNAIWDKRGPLGAGEWERVRMVPYLTDRMLQPSPALRVIGALAAQQCERMDGSGYPRGLAGAAIPPTARILAAADTYQAMCEPRPHRPARTPAAAAEQIRAEVRAGRLQGDAVEAVLGAAGHRTRRRPEQPRGLTEREVEVLRLAAQGLSTREIAEQLSIAPKTAGNHIEHIYSKIGATNRAEASLFAVQHGLFSLEVERSSAP